MYPILHWILNSSCAEWPNSPTVSVNGTKLAERFQTSLGAHSWHRARSAPRALGCSRAFGCSGVPLAVGLLCTQSCIAGDVECGGRIRLAVCAREQRGSDVRTRAQLRRALRSVSTFALAIDWEQRARAPHLAVSLCPGGCVCLVRVGAVECDRVLCGLAVL